MKFVKSTYGGKWIGVVLADVNGGKNNTISLCLIVRDGGGNIPKRRIVKTLSNGWLLHHSPIDISMINKDWFDYSTLNKEKYRFTEFKNLFK